MALRLRGATSGYIELKAPASAGDNTLTLPTNNGSANQLLKTDGSGNLSWTNDNSGVSLSGSTNNTIATVTGANALIGEANLTFDGSVLNVVGNVDINNGTGQAHYEISQTNGNTVKFGIVSGSDIELSGSANNSMYFKTNNTERFRIAGNGKIYVGGTTASDTIGEMWFNDTSAYSSIIKQAGGSSALTFHTGQSQPEKIRIDSGGKVGIGTSSPTFILDIRKNATAVKAHIGASDGSLATMPNSSEYGLAVAGGNVEFGLHKDGSGNYQAILGTYQGSTDIPLIFRTASRVERLRIKQNGQFDFAYQTNTAPPTPTMGANEGLQIYATRHDSSNFLGTVDFIANRGSDNTNGGAQMRFFVQKRASGTNPIESLRINRTGNVQIVSEILCIGASTNTGGASSADFGIEYAGNVKNAIKCRNTYGGNGNAAVFITGSTEVGSIVQGNSATSYNESSDYRLKENEVEISDGITRLKTLKPYRFNWKIDPDTRVDGFFAHEITAVPEAVKGTKDEVASEDIDTLNIKKDDPIYQQIDKSKLVPLITAALKEAIAKIETLETKVAALEST